MIYSIDGSLEGLLCAVFESYQNKEIPDFVTENGDIQTNMFAEIKDIILSAERAERVRNCVIKYGDAFVVWNLKIALKSCDTAKFYKCFNYIKLFIDRKKDASKMFSDPAVIAFNEMLQRVLFEKHRIEGFLRFSETISGVLYAHYEPDNDITELIAPHFKSRLSRQPFIIHDLKRNKFALCDGFTLKYAASDAPVSIVLSDNEEHFQSLWKRYFKSVNIEERKNLRQQTLYMPKRYRKHMLETFDE